MNETLAYIPKEVLEAVTVRPDAKAVKCAVIIGGRLNIITFGETEAEALRVLADWLPGAIEHYAAQEGGAV